MALVSGPFVAVAILFYAVVIGVRQGPDMTAPARGPGAGQTGGANAIGEWLASGARDTTVAQRREVEGRLAEAEAAHEAEVEAVEPELAEPEKLPQGFVLVVKDLSDVSSDERPVFVASNAGGWNPADPRTIMEPRSDQRWQFITNEPIDVTGRLEFKFTLGSWDTVETDAEGADTENRTLPLVDVSTLEPGERPIIEMEVIQFREAPEGSVGPSRVDPYRPINASGTIRRLPVSGGAGGAAGLVRDLIVWLPPGYDDTDRTYPAMYLFDGQNLFDALPGVHGEWRADETATRLVSAGRVEPMIIVGVPHADRFRAEEYLPDRLAGAIDGVNARGDDFAEWFMREVKPRAERAFRIDPSPEQTVIGGASLGAVIAMHIADKNPGQFGGLLIESIPAFEGDRPPMDAVRAIDSWPGRVFVGMGGREINDNIDANLEYLTWANALADYLREQGVDTALVIEPNANHNEDAWAERFPAALRFFFTE